MSKYEAWFCHCGRIHLMNNDKYDWLSKDFRNRKIIRICQNCGATRQTWLDEYFIEDEDDPRPSFTVCGSDVKEGEFIGDSNTQFIFSKGIRVPLKSGAFAEYHGPAGGWFDDKGKCEVWTDRLIQNIQREFKDEAEDVLNSISGYVAGINWEGTLYSHEEKMKRSSNPIHDSKLMK